MYVLELVGERDAFARYEAACLATDVRQVGPGVAVADCLGARVDQLAYTRHISRLVARTSLRVEAATRALMGAALERGGSVAVRARAIRGADLDTQRMERALGDVLVDAGFTIDLESPDHELRAVGTDGTCVLAWHDRSPTRAFADRQPTDRPFFRPGSMPPRLARALVNIAGAGPTTVIMDPMCGTGGLVLEAGLVGARALGSDVDQEMVAGTRLNVASLAPGAEFALMRADATRLPVRPGAVDGVVFDAPYGRQSHVRSTDPATLVRDTLHGCRGVTDRVVIVTDRSLDPSPPGWTIEARFSHRVHRSLTRYVHVLGPGASAVPSGTD